MKVRLLKICEFSKIKQKLTNTIDKMMEQLRIRFSTFLITILDFPQIKNINFNLLIFIKGGKGKRERENVQNSFHQSVRDGTR